MFNADSMQPPWSCKHMQHRHALLLTCTPPINTFVLCIEKIMSLNTYIASTSYNCGLSGMCPGTPCEDIDSYIEKRDKNIKKTKYVYSSIFNFISMYLYLYINIQNVYKHLHT